MAFEQRILIHLYNVRSQWLVDAHADLNDAVAAAYGWSPDLEETETPAQVAEPSPQPSTPANLALQNLMLPIVRILRAAALSALVVFAAWSPSQAFTGLESNALAPVAQAPGEWGLKIVFFDFGQADAILLHTPDADVALIDTGRTGTHGMTIAEYLLNPTRNGVGRLTTVGLLYSTHYDADHIGGLQKLVDSGIRVVKAFDQGPSGKRSLRTEKGNPTFYSRYVSAVGDPDGDSQVNPGEPSFIRHRIEPGDIRTMGHGEDVEIVCVAVRGDTADEDHQLALEPAGKDEGFDENPGSVALIVRLGEFELYTAGDQTSGRWKPKPAVEEAVLQSGAIPNGNDIDVLKVNHHGSDTSTGDHLAREMRPEVAVISTKYGKKEKLPKRIVLKQLEEVRSYVLITGKGRGPDGRFAESVETTQDDAYTASPAAVFDNQGDVTVLVSRDGTRYTVIGREFSKTFSSVDSDNPR